MDGSFIHIKNCNLVEVERKKKKKKNDASCYASANLRDESTRCNGMH